MIVKVAYTFLLIKGAVVGLERSVNQTAEGVGVVEVCAIVYHPHQECPIAFPFNITLSTVDHNAGVSVTILGVWLYDIIFCSDHSHV